MKRINVLIVILLCLSGLLSFAQSKNLSVNFSSSKLPGVVNASGNWHVKNGLLIQENIKETMAIISFPVKQKGEMLYQFDLKYIAGGEDDYAGFGLHISVDKPAKNRSWGNGKSVLLWLTYDPDQYGYPGFFAQIYTSKNNVKMGLDPKIHNSSNPLKDGDEYPIPEEYLKEEYIGSTIPVKMIIDLDTGIGKIYDPLDSSSYYAFYLGQQNLEGNYVSIRTNSLVVSIDNILIKPVDE